MPIKPNGHRVELISLGKALRHGREHERLEVLQEVMVSEALRSGVELQEISARVLREMVGRGSLSTHSTFLKKWASGAVTKHDSDRDQVEFDDIESHEVYDKNPATQAVLVKHALSIKDLKLEVRRLNLSSLLNGDAQGAKALSGTPMAQATKDELYALVQDMKTELKREIADSVAKNLSEDFKRLRVSLEAISLFKELAAREVDQARNAVQNALEKLQAEKSKVATLQSEVLDLRREVQFLKNGGQ